MFSTRHYVPNLPLLLLVLSESLVNPCRSSFVIENVWRGFASDNYAGIHPEVLAAIASANVGHQTAYGADVVTERLGTVVRQHFGDQAEVFPVFNGTGANVVALQAMMQRWEAVICASSAHINADEGGAPEKMAGLKLWTVPAPDGKLTPELIDVHAFGFGDVHRAQPSVVSITQSTEMGTIYTPEEVRAICEHAHSLGMSVHMDGARISNAAAALGVGMRAFTTDAGVDLLSLGGTKNGAMGAEAVVVLNPRFSSAVPFVRKTSMQLSSKMRFTSAQLVGLFEGDLWLQLATHSNSMAAALDKGVRAIDGIEVPRPTQANAVFARLPMPVIERLQQQFRFYVWDQTLGEVRWMCSWDTSEQDVEDFLTAIRHEMSHV
jgi:threonine aldolase